MGSAEVDRVLKRHAHAVWIQITHTAPELRLEMLRHALPRPTVDSKSGAQDPWTVGYHSLGADESDFEYFVYMVQRRPQFAVVRAGEGDGDGVEVARAIDESGVQSILKTLRQSG